jgi:hypothetical protein
MTCSLALLVWKADAQERVPRRGSNGAGRVAKDEDGLSMTPPVACLSIDGYERYEKLPGAALTSEEKLQIYYRPLNYKIVHQGDEYLAHFTQDGQIRRRGKKAVLRRKQNILDYEAKSPRPPHQIFLKNSVPLKGLPVGAYEYDITLRDENNPGASVTQSLVFRVIPPALPKAQKSPARRESETGS